MAHPGFPIGGVDPLGGVDPRCGHFSVKMCVKTKELGPIGGVRRHAPRSANDITKNTDVKIKVLTSGCM